MPGTQLLLKSFISGWQLKFIWVILKILLGGNGWRMELTFPRMNYHLQPTLARLAFRRSATSSICLPPIHQLKMLKADHVGFHQWPHNLLRSSSKQTVRFGALGFTSRYSVWLSVIWKSIKNEKCLPPSGFTKNHSVGSHHPICLEPTAYQASIQEHLHSISRKIPGMHSPLWMESRVDCFLCSWRWHQGRSGEDMKTNIKCKDCNEALCFTPKRNGFYEFCHMCSIFIYAGGKKWLNNVCVICTLKASPSMGPNLVTGKGKVPHDTYAQTYCPKNYIPMICISYAVILLLYRYTIQMVRYIVGIRNKIWALNYYIHRKKSR